MENKKIYIVLTYTGTFLAHLIKKVYKSEYSHCSLSLNNNFDKMYSFSRKYARNPFVGEFKQEDLRTGLYKIKKNSKLLILEKEIPAVQYDKLEKDLLRMYSEKILYSYNNIGIINMYLKKTEQLLNKFTCSQFLAYILNKQDVLTIEEPSLFYPSEFLNFDLKVFYQGTIKDYLNSIKK